MRATEALHLSNPDTVLEMDIAHLCNHFDVARNMRNRELIKVARKRNRQLALENKVGMLF